MMYNNFINFWKHANCIRLIYYLISWNKLLFMQEDEWLRWKYRMFRKFKEINMDNNTFPHIFVSTGRQEVVPTELTS